MQNSKNIYITYVKNIHRKSARMKGMIFLNSFSPLPNKSFNVLIPQNFIRKTNDIKKWGSNCPGHKFKASIKNYKIRVESSLVKIGATFSCGRPQAHVPLYTAALQISSIELGCSDPRYAFLFEVSFPSAVCLWSTIEI